MKAELRIAVLTHSLKTYNVHFLDIVHAKDHHKFKPVIHREDLAGERFAGYITLWDFGRERGAEELEFWVKERIIK